MNYPRDDEAPSSQGHSAILRRKRVGNDFRPVLTHRVQVRDVSGEIVELGQDTFDLFWSSILTPEAWNYCVKVNGQGAYQSGKRDGRKCFIGWRGWFSRIGLRGGKKNQDWQITLDEDLIKNILLRLGGDRSRLTHDNIIKLLNLEKREERREADVLERIRYARAPEDARMKKEAENIYTLMEQVYSERNENRARGHFENYQDAVITYTEKWLGGDEKRRVKVVEAMEEAQTNEAIKRFNREIIQLKTSPEKIYDKKFYNNLRWIYIIMKKYILGDVENLISTEAVVNKFTNEFVEDYWKPYEDKIEQMQMQMRKRDAKKSWSERGLFGGSEWVEAKKEILEGIIKDIEDYECKKKRGLEQRLREFVETFK